MFDQGIVNEEYNNFHKKTQQVHESFVQFRDSLKDTLINEAITSIYMKAIPTTIKEMCTGKGMALEDVCRGFVHDIVNENGGYTKIYNKMKHNGLFDTHVNLIESVYQEVLESVDKDHPERRLCPDCYVDVMSGKWYDYDSDD